jgi:hypothetical protein
MKHLWILFLLLPTLSYAGVAKIAIVPDTQNGTSCVRGAPAWDMLEASFTYLDALTNVDYLIQVGDVVQKNALTTGADCWCLGQVDPGDCGDITGHPIAGATCAACGYADAISCDGGISGLYCEWSRAKTLHDMLAVPQLWCDGNHDYDVSALLPNFFTAYNLHFDNAADPYVEASGKLIVTNTDSQPTPAVWQIFTAGGVQYLSFGIPLAPWWRSSKSGAALDRDEIIAWMLKVIDDHPGMPTMISGHLMVTSFEGSVPDPFHPSAMDCGFCEDETEALNSDSWMGKDMFNRVASVRPQVFLIIGGHDRDTRHIVTTTDNGDRVIGVLVDYSYGFDSDRSDIPLGSYLDSAVAPAQAGGGVVAFLNIDPKGGRIWSWAKASHSDATDGTTATDGRDMRYGEGGSTWIELMPLCADNRRFNIPAAACD